MSRTTAKPPAVRVYWVLRGLESFLLVVALVGMGMFAWSIVDIARMQAGGGMPHSAWWGVGVFLAAMVLLQALRVVLHRYRREDGTPRGDARGAAAAATAEVLGYDDGTARATPASEGPTDAD